MTRDGAPVPHALATVLRAVSPCAVAVSGGVDSLTLAAAAARVGVDLLCVHATSPAVPAEATARTRALAAAHGWSLIVLDSGEFADPRYRRNGADRCYICKGHLYDAAAHAAPGRTILSGTNFDDLNDIRPGLTAAGERGVRHPFVEAGLDKAAVRALAAALGLGDVATLPAAPCLSSRIETGLRVEAEDLALAHTVEGWIRDWLRPQTVRCRVRRAGLVVELDAAALDALDVGGRTALLAGLRVRAPGRPVTLARYAMGSAAHPALKAAE
ncbi:adenine nucleotide alpha hydrolase [Roseospira marina]|uniref:Adenine nucleotide alpha hydrolase n=1 Tax=Roseospira marina TaxID=140057 RepID=A0A5M6ICR3_9PROT|nr:adenine nucleotide alpha hydrolase [Roseospira marina]KAA5605993.1 adenine nucleotide alpha hydrolase [Roseospira marina]MBB4313154.1 uncharacterized protein [Roseospira marina]MBB5086105.1 uncharacterized protein [Roseospira marina]